MKKLTKLERSQKAHDRLSRVYDSKPNTDINRCKYNYHATVYNYQSRHLEVMPKNKRKELYNATYQYDVKKNNSSNVIRTLLKFDK